MNSLRPRLFLPAQTLAAIEPSGRRVAPIRILREE
jgi:hypothetical protein